MNRELLALLCVLGSLHGFTTWYLWFRTEAPLTFKAVWTMVGTLPMIGPLLFWTVANVPHRQSADLQSNETSPESLSVLDRQ